MGFWLTRCVDANQALFTGESVTPVGAVGMFVDNAVKWGLHPALFQ